MFNSTIIDLVIGLVFVYLLLAIICTAVNEWISGLLNSRASNLKAAITQLLDNQESKDNATKNWFLDKFYAHPLIVGMHDPGKRPGKGHPSYLPARAFASVVMDISTPAQLGAITFDDLETGIKNLPDGDVKKSLLAVIQSADRRLSTAQRNIETWYDDTMERVGGWYKRKIQLWTFFIAVALTIACNADTIRMSSVLWRNPTQRARMVEIAKGRAQQPGGGNQPPTKEELSELDNLLGWEGKNVTAPQSDTWYVLWGWRLVGWFLTVVAVSLGAPFWFDLLNKIVNLRNTGRKPESEQPPLSDSPPPTPQAPTLPKTS